MFIDDNDNWIASRLTTVDNKWNPFTQFSEWYNEDVHVLNYNTCGFLALRINEHLKENHLKADEMSDYDYAKLVDQVILNIVDEFPLLFRRVESKDSFVVDNKQINENETN